MDNLISGDPSVGVILPNRIARHDREIGGATHAHAGATVASSISLAALPGMISPTNAIPLDPALFSAVDLAAPTLGVSAKHGPSQTAVQGEPHAAAAGHMSFVLDFAPGSSLSAPLSAALTYAANYLGNLIADPVAVTIQVQATNLNSNSMSGILATGNPTEYYLPYAKVVSELQIHDPSAAKYLPATLPAGAYPQIDVSKAEEQVWGISLGNKYTAGGTIDINTAYASQFYPGHGPNVPGGQIDFFGTALHELTHALGRVSDNGFAGVYVNGNTLYNFGVLNLFRFDSPGTLQVVGVKSATNTTVPYFSVNGGKTDLVQFAAVNRADWGGYGTTNYNAYDPFNGSGVPGKPNTITPVDRTVMNALGFDIQCYSRGTRIETPLGDIEIESLAVGDLVFTASGAARPIRWIGTRSFDPRFVGRNPKILPIRICKDALADGVPRRDLLVSPEHAMLIDGVLIAAKHLVNGVSIRQEDPGATIDYFHIELDTHDAVLAEGAASETYIEDGDRGMFHNAPEDRAAQPPQPARYCAERIEAGPRLEAMCATLEARAGVRALITEDPAIHLLADGIVVLPVSASDGILGFDLPCPAADIALVSRQVAGTGADRRGLGIAVGGVVIDGEPVDLGTLPDRGWHEVERDGARRWRWTDGAAQIPATTQPCRIAIEVAGTLRYRAFARAA